LAMVLADLHSIFSCSFSAASAVYCMADLLLKFLPRGEGRGMHQVREHRSQQETLGTTLVV
jgi:hypothetical protein